MMTKEQIEKIEAKLAKGKKLDRSEWCEGFEVMEDGTVTDRHIHDMSKEDDDYAIQLSRVARAARAAKSKTT